MLDFVENGLKDNDGEVLEEGAGEEVHLTCGKAGKGGQLTSDF